MRALSAIVIMLLMCGGALATEGVVSVIDIYPVGPLPITPPVPSTPSPLVMWYEVGEHGELAVLNIDEIFNETLNESLNDTLTTPLLLFVPGS